MREKEAKRRYHLELAGSMLLYFAILAASIRFARPMGEGTARTLLLVSPMIAIAVSIWVMVRGFRRMDEFVRLRSLESIGIAFAITAGTTFTYGFLETAGFPRLSMFVVWGVMGVSWIFASCLRNWITR